MSDELLDRLITDARAHVEDEIVRERRLVGPDFVAVVAEAHERHPDRIDAATLREVGELAPIVELAAELGDSAGDTGLDALIELAQAEAEADIAARRLTEIPPLTSPEPVEVRREVPGFAVAIALAAIVAGLAFAVPRLLESLVDSSYDEAETSHNQAKYLEQGDEPDSGVRRQPGPRIEPELQRAVTHERPSSAKVEPQPQLQPQPQPQPQVEPQHTSGLRDRITQLEAEAQGHWAAGELERAEASYRAIVAIAGRSRYADLAWGDLFTLAHQRGDPTRERDNWHAYLRDFPRGRFAEDARAGLCRRAPEIEREACWRSYLDDFPDAVHATAANRALAEPDADREARE